MITLKVIDMNAIIFRMLILNMIILNMIILATTNLSRDVVVFGLLFVFHTLRLLVSHF